jgi:hypothetical protein
VPYPSFDAKTGHKSGQLIRTNIGVRFYEPQKMLIMKHVFVVQQLQKLLAVLPCEGRYPGSIPGERNGRLGFFLEPISRRVAPAISCMKTTFPIWHRKKFGITEES